MQMSGSGGKYQRFQPASVPPVISNAHIHSFAVNEYTQELLYVTNTMIALVSLESMTELKRIPFASLVRSDPTRVSDRKFQEVLQQYVTYGLNFLTSLPHLNIWLGVINKRRVICFSEELEISNEVTLDSSGVVGLHVHPVSGDLFVLGVEGKIFVMTCEYSFEMVRKRVGPQFDFEVKVNVKKQIGTDASLSKLVISYSESTYFIAVSDIPAPQVEIHIWNHTSGEKLPSLQHGDSYSQSLTISALATYNSILTLIDSTKTLSIIDFLSRQELIRTPLAAYVGPIENIILEDCDITAGIYIVESTGKISDFVPGFGLDSFFYSYRRRESITPTHRTQDRSAIPSVNKGFLTGYGKAFTSIKLVVQHTGLRQLWLLADGSLEVINLASIGRVMEGRGVKKVERKGDVGLCYGENGEVSILDLASGKVRSKVREVVKSFVDREHTTGLFVPAFTAYIPDLQYLAFVSNNGLLKFYGLENDIVSLNYYMQKKTFTAASFIPLSHSESLFDSVFGTSHGEVLVTSFNKYTKEVALRRKYAAHDEVVFVRYLKNVERVVTVGREGVVRFLTFPEYNWDVTFFKGFWNDCTACTLSGTSLLLLGYESGMLQTLYFSFNNSHPSILLLEYHIFKITAVCGLPSSTSEAVSGDSSGFIVLWNVDTGKPLKVFSVISQVNSLLISGSMACDRLYVVLGSGMVSLSLKTKARFLAITNRDIRLWKEDRSKKRTEYRGRKVAKKVQVRTSSMTSLEDAVRKETGEATLGNVTLVKKVNVAKSIVMKDPLEVKKPARIGDGAYRSEVKRLTDEWVMNFRNRPMNHILEHNRIERLKKSVSKVIKYISPELPAELAYSHRGLRRISPLLRSDRLPPTNRSTQSLLDKSGGGGGLTGRDLLTNRTTATHMLMKDLFGDKLLHSSSSQL